MMLPLPVKGEMLPFHASYDMLCSMKKAGFCLADQNEAAILGIEAECKTGTLIPQQFPHGGDKKASFQGGRLKDFGITWQDSHRWQSRAAIKNREEYYKAAYKPFKVYLKFFQRIHRKCLQLAGQG
jgi:hypothetical protein